MTPHDGRRKKANVWHLSDDGGKTAFCDSLIDAHATGPFAMISDALCLVCAKQAWRHSRLRAELIELLDKLQ